MPLPQLHLLPVLPPQMRGPAAAGIALACAAASMAWTVLLTQRSEALRELVAAASAPTPRVGKERAPAAAADFVQGLAAQSGQAETLVDELQSRTALVGVQVLAVSSSVQPATARTLGREELSLTLRGSYGPLKQALADTLARHPNAVLQRLTLRRQAAGGAIEAAWVLSLLSAPLAAAPAASAMR